MNFYLDKIKSILPYIAGFAVLACLIFYPELQGKKLGASDSVSWIAASKEYKDYADKGETIKWTNRVFAGMPLYTIAGDLSGNFVLKAYGKISELFPTNIFQMFAVFLCCFIGLILLGIDKNVSFILSIAFGLNTWILDSLWASHPTKILSLAFLIPVITGFITYIKNDNKWGLIAIMFGLSTSIAYGHYQIIYYGSIICFFIGVYFLYESIVAKRIGDYFKKVVFTLAAVLIAVMTCISGLYVTNDYNKDTMRGGKSEITKEGANSTGKSGGLNINYAFSWSYTTAELLNFIVPDAMGGSSNYSINKSKSKLAEQMPASEDDKVALPFYWGVQPFTGAPNYLGAAVMFLFVFSMLYWKNKMKFLFLGIILLSIFMGLGKSFLGFNEILFNKLPLYNKFRTPTMSFAILNVMTILTIGFGLQSFLTNQDDTKEEILKILKRSAYVMIAILVLGFIYVSSQGYTSENDTRIFKDNMPALNLIMEDRASLLKSDLLRSIFIIALVIGTLYMYLQQRISKKLILILLGAITFLDLFTVYKRYLTTDVFQKVEKAEDMIPNESYNQILEQDKSYFRVMNFATDAFNSNFDGFRFSNVGGYSPAKLYRYQDIIDVHLSKGNMPVLNMLNTKYIIVDNQGQKVPQQNPDACGNAWFIQQVKFAKDANEEMDSIGTFNPKTTVWIDKRFQNETTYNINTDTGASIILTKYHPEHMEYEAKSSSGGFAVFSEIWYRGNEDWNLYVDGKPQKLVRVNYILRGAYIPAGNHKVEMKFTVKKLDTFKMISMLFTLIMCLATAFMVYKHKKTVEHV